MSYDEITDQLIEQDLKLMQSNGHNVGNVWIEDKSNTVVNGDIIRLCIHGICLYNKLSVQYYDKEFISYVIDNLEMFLEHGNIPSFMQEYYIDVLNRGNVDYLNRYLLRHGNKEETGQEKGRRISKSTAVGRALSDSEAAFASVLILPAMLALIYISVVVIYFIFFYNGG